MNSEKLWYDTVNLIKQEMSKPSFDTWFTKAEFLKQEDNIIYVDTQNEFQRDWLDGRYSKRVNEIIKELSNETIEVVYVCTHASEPQETFSSKPLFHQEDLLQRIQILENKVQTLESYIEEMKSKK